ncbi:MAG: methyltransferase, partial [Nanoarchaeota archaeon]
MKQEKKCRMCQENDFKRVIDFGQNPLVNSLIDKKDLDKTEPTFPLVVEQCQKCFLVQIVSPIDSHKIYKNVDYLYFSGDMPNLADYFYWFYKDIKSRFNTDFVVEIGSNDGIFLQFFAKDNNVLGIDPSTNVVVRALKNGIPTISDFFSERLANSVVRENGQADIVAGSNCIAHLNNLEDLMLGVKALLKDSGVFIVECNYWGGMV